MCMSATYLNVKVFDDVSASIGTRQSFLGAVTGVFFHMPVGEHVPTIITRYQSQGTHFLHVLRHGFRHDRGPTVLGAADASVRTFASAMRGHVGHFNDLRATLGALCE
jgi:hypothetical protein